MAIDHKISRSEFISDRFVLLLIERYRIKMCYGQMLFFSYKNAHITYLAFHSKPPIRKITLACVACLCFVCVVVAQSKTARDFRLARRIGKWKVQLNLVRSFFPLKNRILFGVFTDNINFFAKEDRSP